MRPAKDMVIHHLKYHYAHRFTDLPTTPHPIEPPPPVPLKSPTKRLREALTYKRSKSTVTETPSNAYAETPPSEPTALERLRRSLSSNKTKITFIDGAGEPTYGYYDTRVSLRARLKRGLRRLFRRPLFSESEDGMEPL